MQKQKINTDKLKLTLTEYFDAMKKIDEAERDGFVFAAISKYFESCLEYAWKYFKRVAEESGFEVASPKEAIKYAGQLGLIDDVELWLEFLSNRNHAVHDYQGMSIVDYLNVIRSFEKEAHKLLQKIE